MKPTTFDIEKAKAVEAAVCSEFECSIGDILGITDTMVKKVVVFVLRKFYDFNIHQIGNAYKMTYLYVPTVVNELENRFMIDVIFRYRIIAVCNEIGYRYEKSMDFAGSRNIA
jgi:hypothetical protein